MRIRAGCRDLRQRKIKSGLSELVLAGGVESMSRAPYVMGKSETPFDKSVKLYDTTTGWRFVNPQLAERYGCDPLGITAENVAQQHQISREDQDIFALNSQQKTGVPLKMADWPGNHATRGAGGS